MSQDKEENQELTNVATDSGASQASGADDLELESSQDVEGAGLEEVPDSEVLAEFDAYESLEEDSVGDGVGEEAEEAAAGADDDGEARISPKERRLSEMRLEARIEAVLFASQKPMKAQDFVDLFADPGLTVDDVQRSLDDLIEFYEARHGGFRLHYLKRLGYQFQTTESAGALMEKMFATRPRPISRAALETLSIIAYRQPVTRAEVEFIRGVDAGSIFKTLLERGLIKCTGRKEVVGRPMLFGTTDEFLKVFNLSSIKDLPPLESFQPSREMVAGAEQRIGEATDLVDVEKYIADGTRAAEEGNAEGIEPEFDEADVPEAADGASDAAIDAGEGGRTLAGAVAAGSWDETDSEPTQVTGGDSAGVENGTDEDSEVAVPDRDRVEAGSGKLDR